MFSRIFTTSWQHISRTRLASVGIIVILTGLFLTFFIGFFLIQQAELQRQMIVKKFNYPVFLNNSYKLEDEKVVQFIGILRDTVAMPDDIQYIHKDKVLDMQIERDPSILKILGWENPLNDIIMIPLYGVDLSGLLAVVKEHNELFESVQTADDMQESLTKFEWSLYEIKRLTQMTTIFLSCIGVLMIILMIVVIRLHIRIFQDEKDICKLVWASPFFYWSPHIVSIIFYIVVSWWSSIGIFFLFRTVFGS
jgi:cell division protein FtsX